MPYCVSCGNLVSDSDSYCDSCGKGIPKHEDSKALPIREAVIPSPTNVSQIETPQETTLDKLEISNSPVAKKRNIRVVTISVFVILVLLGLFTYKSQPKFDAKGLDFNAEELMNEMINLGYCDTESNSELKGADSRKKAAYKAKLFRECELSGSSLRMRSGLVLSKTDFGWFFDGPSLLIRIEAGNAVNLNNSIREPWRYSSAIYGNKWIMYFITQEAVFPGAFQFGKNAMKATATKLNAELSPSYKPQDSCVTFIATSVTKYDANGLAFCKKYFPEAFNFQNWEKWKAN